MQKEYSSDSMAIKVLVDRSLRKMKHLKEDIYNFIDERADELEKVRPEYRLSAYNLAAYLSLRRHDIRELQLDLRMLGLSSLGGIEARVLPSIDAVLLALYHLAGQSISPKELDYDPINHFLGENLLVEHAISILGESPKDRNVRVMVTMPSEAADDPALIKDLLASGMNIMRVNCAHDGPETWTRMVEYLRQAEQELGKKCLVSFDLAGPKLRTGSVVSSPETNVEPGKPPGLLLSTGDTLIITPADQRGEPAIVDDAGKVIEPAHIGCTLPEVFRDIQVGEHVFLDDGKFSGIVREKAEDQFRVEITHAKKGQALLAAEKGINLPETKLDLPALTAKDIEDLEFVVKYADLISLSFVQRKEDIEQLVSELKRHNADDMAVILKIEGQSAFNNLPELLLTSLQHQPTAVMIARGDLGVEVGFERLAEVQEEILWLCEAAHVPVIWATQVLESLAKKGIPSRAEVTDAAMAARAECVMLNKGPYMNSVMEFLNDVLQRMQTHQDKKHATLRKLDF